MCSTQSKHADMQSCTNTTMQGMHKWHVWSLASVFILSRDPKIHVLIYFLINCKFPLLYKCFLYWTLCIFCCFPNPSHRVRQCYDREDAQCHDVQGRMEIAGSAGDREHARPEAPSGLTQARVWQPTRPVHNVLLHMSEICVSAMSQLIRD